ncbi:hypothetical protein ONE63_011026 [Megalurothrips usitatus]|uniref:Uncharacterized protein n=1 Tax=Megalurothrips usitatus TaxID=439358 RepID=A0AAV7XFT1_9NEOP|nr:hypothetical protein ONE63_011026 [Megalurothrips usitatus]
MHTWLTPPRRRGPRPPRRGRHWRHQDAGQFHQHPLSAEPEETDVFTFNPMAHFVKWCKARFLNGYKQFSGE